MDKEVSDDEQDNKPCSLQLTYQGLTEFPEDLLTKDIYRDLNHLYLGRNLISTLPENLTNLSSLTGLFINHNKLKHLPEGVGVLQNLETLTLTGNELTELPNGLGKLSKLDKLSIGNNKLSKLPPCIGNLIALRILEVTNNNLTTIPVELSCCKNLQTLNLDNNRLTFLPRQLRKLENLCELSAVGNNLYVLPQEIGGKHSLRSLYVDKNQSLFSLPSSVHGKDIGFISCAKIPLSAEVLEHFIHVKVQHTPTDKLPILLPLDLQHICNNKFCIPSLLELSLRVAADKIYPKDIEGNVPNNLSSLISCPTAQCENCDRDIFLSAFPVVFKDRLYAGYILGMCCSLDCVKKCYRTRILPLVYPSLEDMSLAMVLVQ